MYWSYIMAFGPHPDDADYWCGASLCSSSADGKHNIVVDLTPSQLSSRWDCEWRCMEAQESAKVMWLKHRFNLGMEDLKIKDDEFHRMQIAIMIRKYKPEIIMLPNFVDRHPDHEETAKLIKNSIFVSWLSSVDYQWLQQHRPRLVMEYMIWDDFEPDLVIWFGEDIYMQKMKAINCFASQRDTNAWAKNYFASRSMKLWRKVGRQYWEWFRVISWFIGVDSLYNIYTKPY